MGAGLNAYIYSLIKTTRNGKEETETQRDKQSNRQTDVQLKS